MKLVYEQHKKYFMDLQLKQKKPTPKEQGLIKYNQLVQKQVLTMVDYVQNIGLCDEYGNSIPRQKVFELVARIFNAKGRCDVDHYKVKWIYDNHVQKK